MSRGIEVANRIRAPALLVLLLVLATYALATGDPAAVRAGLAFAFAPNFSAITPQVVLAAIGQAFYATGVGMAMMLAYGSYMARGTSLVRPALYISGSILLVSLLATLTIFPLVFRYGMDPAQGSELVFDVLATVFAEMPGRPAHRHAVLPAARPRRAHAVDRRHRAGRRLAAAASRRFAPDAPC